uniref:CSON000807 protein n=1 Tax=Culicoides sonorensis TaxID=179676 RepID=A0A336LQB9_CULSO
MIKLQRSSVLCGILLTIFIHFCLGAPSSKQYDLTTFLAPDSIESTQQDTDVAALEHLKQHHSTTHETKEPTLPGLEKQLEAQTELNIPHNVDVHDVESPFNEKPTTITSNIKSETIHHDHERPDTPPFDEKSLPHHEEQHTEDDEHKPTPKTFTGAARLMTQSAQSHTPHTTEKRIKLNMNHNKIQV